MLKFEIVGYDIEKCPHADGYRMEIDFVKDDWSEADATHVIGVEAIDRYAKTLAYNLGYIFDGSRQDDLVCYGDPDGTYFRYYDLKAEE